jgi:virginiamycin B lyase
MRSVHANAPEGQAAREMEEVDAPGRAKARAGSRGGHRRDRRVAAVAAVAVLAMVAGLVLTARPALATTVTEYPVTPSTGPEGIALGSDGNIWFTEEAGNNIGRITKLGVVTEFAIPTANSSPRTITAGPDGSLWFTEFNTNKIGRITTSGTITEFSIPTAGSFPWTITSGPDGRLWFTETQVNQIGRLTTTGSFTEFSIPTAASGPIGITSGPDGNLWFTEGAVDQIGRITTSGTVTEFTGLTSGSQAFGIAPGADGNLWFTEETASQIGRITTAGVVTEFTIPTASAPISITPGPDGNLYFGEGGGGNVGEITTAGVITEIPVPSGDPVSIVPGSDGGMWFTEFGPAKIGTFQLPHLNIHYIFYIPNRFFIPNIASLSKQGELAKWLILAPGSREISDTSGMGLFASRGSVPIGAEYGFAFVAAGTYAYDDPLHPAAQGQVRVPISVKLLPGATNQAQVYWAQNTAPAGYVFDVQVRQPGSSSFVDWRVGQTAPSGVFGPPDPLYVGPGTYSFQARLRKLSNGAHSGYSLPRSITLS